MSDYYDDMVDYSNEQSYDDQMAALEERYFSEYITYCNDSELDPEDYTFEDWANDQLPEYA